MKIAFAVVGILLAVASPIAGAFGMPEVMMVAAVLCALLLLAANLDRIEQVRASPMTGLEAKTRAIVDEAQATIDQLRLVGKIAVQANLTLIARTGRWGGLSYDEKEAIRLACVQALSTMGVPTTEQEQMLAELRMVTRFDYAHLLLGSSTIPAEVQTKPDLVAEWTKLRGGGFKSIPSPAAVEAFLRRAGMLDTEREQLLEDYRYYEKHSEHRRPAILKQLVDRDA